MAKDVTGFLGGLSRKEPPTNAGDIETQVWSLGWKIPWSRKRQPAPAWRIPQTEEPGRLRSMGFQRVRHD